MTSDPFQDLRAKNRVVLNRYDRGVITRVELELKLAENAVDLLSVTLAEARATATTN